MHKPSLIFGSLFQRKMPLAHPMTSLILSKMVRSTDQSPGLLCKFCTPSNERARPVSEATCNSHDSCNSLSHWFMLCIVLSEYFMLHIHAGSPSVTSLTYNNRSRTLTCTSTGGPATTVTWRRNGVVITLNATHQQTKTLVDPVTGTYQTVLTIDSSVGLSGLVGNYNCTVENIRGMSSRSVFVGETSSLLLILAITPYTHCPVPVRIVCQ